MKGLKTHPKSHRKKCDRERSCNDGNQNIKSILYELHAMIGRKRFKSKWNMWVWNDFCASLNFREDPLKSQRVSLQALKTYILQQERNGSSFHCFDVLHFQISCRKPWSLHSGTFQRGVAHLVLFSTLHNSVTTSCWACRETLIPKSLLAEMVPF